MHLLFATCLLVAAACGPDIAHGERRQLPKLDLWNDAGPSPTYLANVVRRGGGR